MHIKNEFILNNGEKVEIITRADNGFQQYVDAMSEAIFTHINERPIVDAIKLTSASEDYYVSIKTKEISSYSASVVVL